MPTLDALKAAGERALLKVGTPPRHAECQIALLLAAELRGHASHGLLRLPRVIERIANGVADPVTTGRATWTGPALLAVDGCQGLGPVVAGHALDLLTARARDTGVAVAGIRACNHLGMLAWYAEAVARQGLVLIALTTSEALVHPWGGRQALIGTNPIAVGVPADPEPFVVDLATSTVSMGRIHDHANRGAPIPPGWALDAAGEPTTDAAAATRGALSPFGGAKGYALGLAFEVLVASLTGSAIGRDVRGTLDSEHPATKGDVFIVLSPVAGGAALATAFLETVRASPPQDPARPVRIPGERAARRERESTGGEIDLPPALWARIQALAR